MNHPTEKQMSIEESIEQIFIKAAQTAAKEFAHQARLEFAAIAKKNTTYCYTEKEAAALLGFKDAQTLARTRKEGFIKHSRIAGGSIRYTPDQLQEFLQRNEYPQKKKKLRTVK